MIPKFSKAPPPPQYNYQRLGDQVPFGGLNLKDSDIGEGQMSYGSKNVNLDDGGKVRKRKGTKYIYTTSLGAGIINGLYKEEFNGRRVFAWGTAIYSQVAAAQPVSLISGLANSKGSFHIFNDVLYYKNGTNFIQISNTFVATTVESNAYIPTITTARSPDGTASTQTSFKINLIQPGFTDSFTGVAVTVAYQLSINLLDATAVTAIVNGVAQVEGVGFTVDRTTGIVTFSVAPGIGAQNNVLITAYKTIAGNANRVKNCLYSELFGGALQDSRIFTAGNPTYKNMYWYTGLTGNTATDAGYFPENNFNRIGSDAKSIVGWTKRYQVLIPVKEDGIYSIVYSSGAITFPASVINSRVGCNMPGSIQIVNNLPVFFNTGSGGWTIVSTWLAEEKNVIPLSVLVNGGVVSRPGILDELTADLQNCSSFDDGQKYGICVGSKVWLWDYERSPFNGEQNALIWCYYDNVNAANWAFYGRNLYYGDRTIGQICEFYDNLNDFGVPIDGIWKGKLNHYGYPDRYKSVKEVRVSTRSSADSTIEVAYLNDNGEQVSTESVPLVGVPTFDLDNLDLDNLNLDTQSYAATIALYPNLENIIHFQIQLRNNVLNEDISILALITKYLINSEVK